MDTTRVQYTGYTIEIPDYLQKPFKVLSTILKGLKVDHPCDLINYPGAADLLQTCSCCVYAAIGSEHAHDGKIGEAFKNWHHLDAFERDDAVIKAALKTEPLDISHMKQTGSRYNFE